MFDSLKSLGKAAIGLAIETPLAIAADAITLGGSLSDAKQPYTATALKKVARNVSAATTPEREREDQSHG